MTCRFVRLSGGDWGVRVPLDNTDFLDGSLEAEPPPLPPGTIRRVLKRDGSLTEVALGAMVGWSCGDRSSKPHALYQLRSKR